MCPQTLCEVPLAALGLSQAKRFHHYSIFCQIKAPAACPGSWIRLEGWMDERRAKKGLLFFFL